LRRERDALRVIAGRERDDAASLRIVSEQRQGIEGASEFERSYSLEILALDEHEGAGSGAASIRGEEADPEADAAT